MSKPGFFFYTGDWLKDTRVLTAEARGCWIDWLCLLYEHGGELAMPVEAWGRYAGVSEDTARHVLHQLEITETADIEWIANASQNDRKTIAKCRNRKMARIIQYREEIRRVRSRAGKNGNRKRWQTSQPSSSSSYSLNLNSEYYKNNILPGIVTQEQLRTGKSHAPKVVKLWPEEDLWLKQFLEKQTYLNNSTGSLLAYDWWEDVAAVLGGIDRTFIERQFAKIGAWLKENPGRRPTAKGARRFLRSWLERARDQERRLYAVKR
jgi:hypothetical protein